jgi:acetyl-CoA carboxylase biotin carboxyl carrier protein
VPAAPPPVAETATGEYVTAHMVGVFYRAAQPGDGPFADLGDVLELGQQVGIIEAMKLMIPVEADVAGRVVEVLVSDGAAVEYGDRLFAVEPVEN